MKAVKSISHDNLQIFCPLVKVDSVKREVWGVVTGEAPDKENEICDYDTTAPFYQAVVDEMSKATDGANIFPLRAMHGLIAAGKGISIEFRKEAKEIYMGFKVVDDAEWKKVEENVYTGFSQGGHYVKKWKDGDYTRYTASPGEVSLVDLPCYGRAHFDFVRADGSVEIRKFAKSEVDVGSNQPQDVDTSEVSKCMCKCTSCVAGKCSSCSAETKCGNSMSSSKATKLFEIETLIDTILHDSVTKHTKGELAKGMYTVGNFAQIVEDVKYLWLSLAYERYNEGDESPATDELKSIFSDLLDAFLSYTEEEVEELRSHAEKFEGELAMAVQSGDLNKVSQAITDQLLKSAAHYEGLATEHLKHQKTHEAATPQDAFQKSMAAYHENLHKKYTAKAEELNLKAEASADAEDDADEDDKKKKKDKKKVAGAEMTEPTTAVKTEASAAAVEPKKDETVAKTEDAAAAGNPDLGSSLDKMLSERINVALSAAFDRVLKSPEFNKAMDEQLAGKMLEKLGDKVKPTEVKSFAVARPGTQATATVDTSAVDPQFAALCAMDTE